jgi:hypothetical protein
LVRRVTSRHNWTLLLRRSKKRAAGMAPLGSWSEAARVKDAAYTRDNPRLHITSQLGNAGRRDRRRDAACWNQRSSLWKKYTVLTANMPNNATPIAIARSITPPDPSSPDSRSYRAVRAIIGKDGACATPAISREGFPRSAKQRKILLSQAIATQYERPRSRLSLTSRLL